MQQVKYSELKPYRNSIDTVYKGDSSDNGTGKSEVLELHGGADGFVCSMRLGLYRVFLSSSKLEFSARDENSCIGFVFLRRQDIIFRPWYCAL